MQSAINARNGVPYENQEYTHTGIIRTVAAPSADSMTLHFHVNASGLVKVWSDTVVIAAMPVNTALDRPVIAGVLPAQLRPIQETTCFFAYSINAGAVDTNVGGQMTISPAGVVTFLAAMIGATTFANGVSHTFKRVDLTYRRVLPI